MCLINESKKPPIKPQYENGEIVCWVIADKWGECYAPTVFSFGSEYNIGERMKAKRAAESFDEPNYKGRHGFLRLKDAKEFDMWSYDVIIKATTRPKDIISYGESYNGYGLRTKAMFYKKVVK